MSLSSTLPVNVIHCPVCFPCCNLPPRRRPIDWGDTESDTHTKAKSHTRQEHEYSNRISNARAAGWREAQRRIHICAQCLQCIHTHTHTRINKLLLRRPNASCKQCVYKSRHHPRMSLSVLDKRGRKQQHTRPRLLYMYTSNMPLACTRLTHCSYRRL